MKRSFSAWIAESWYRDSLIGPCLSPLSLIYGGVVRLRKKLYALGILQKCRLPVPVIVVGNLTVGGTGKTPLIIWLARFLKEAGYKPGIISRGYGGQSQYWPQWVDSNSDPKTVGDEAKLIANLTGCPMAVAPLRAAAGKMLLDRASCNIILSDDGLQHYALDRDMEIAVIDGTRRFGNGYCLPSGPLREPITRLNEVDAVIVNGEKSIENEFSMRLQGDTAVNLMTGEKKPLREFAGLPCHALAGIGNPERFFKQLALSGLTCQTHAFPDHYPYRREDIEFGDDWPVLMTDKDAVKCRAFAGNQHWRIPVVAVPEPAFSERLLNLLREQHGR
jgi:tetraacyldisaccharide 4'-kinase